MRVLYGLIIMLGFLGCNMEVESNTKLELTVFDDHLMPAIDYNVNLYENYEDWFNDKHVLKNEKTNDKGVVTFSDLNDTIYFFRIIKGCLSNSLGVIGSNTLVKDNFNTFHVQVRQTSNFTIVNNSNNTYLVSYDGKPQYNINGKSVLTFKNGFPVDTVIVRAIQLDGFILFPTDLTFTVVAECDSVEGVVIP